MIFTVNSIRHGEKEFANGKQSGIYVEGVVKTKTGQMDKTMFIASYFEPEMIAVIESAGVGAILDFAMKKMEGAKGPYFVPKSVTVVSHGERKAPQQAGGQAKNPPAKSANQGATAPADGGCCQTAVPAIVLQEAVRYVLGMLGTAIKPAKSTPEVLDTLVAHKVRFFASLLKGEYEFPESSASDLDERKGKQSKDPEPMPEIPDVGAPDDDDIPF